MFGILGCGSSRKKAIISALNSVRFATVAKGGASVVEPFSPDPTDGSLHTNASQAFRPDKDRRRSLMLAQGRRMRLRDNKRADYTFIDLSLRDGPVTLLV
jgi:hypothetical protein